jgi:hypothetical protein
MTSAKQMQTTAARLIRWPGTPELRRKTKTEKIVLYIARLGWATTSLVNYYMSQSSQAWPKQLEDQGLLYRQKIIIGSQTKSRTKANGRIATILLLTDAGQRLARKLDSRLEKRIAMPSLNQARHDLIAFWAATHAVKERWDCMLVADKLQIWSDQVMRTFIHDSDIRPDASVYRSKDSEEGEKFEVILNIEVERSKKKSGLEEYKFMKKMKRYSNDSARETLVVCETEGRAKAIVELLERAEIQGIKDYYYNESAQTWWPRDFDDPIRFRCRAIVVLWNMENHEMTLVKYHNL